MDNITNGEWVTCEYGIAKILHIFPKYAEEESLKYFVILKGKL
jgi:hypothetical protein